MNDANFEWISVSELAKRINKTTQTAYNQCRAGKWETMEFKRGDKMKGILVKYPLKQ
jgi:hypothetical protein